MQTFQYNEIIQSQSLENLLQQNTVEKPIANLPQTIVVRIIAASVNPVDWLVLRGYLQGAGWALPFPFTLGYDFAGYVDSTSPEVVDYVCGDRVFGCNWGIAKHDDAKNPVIAGSFAEYILVHTSVLSKLPENVSFETGAAIALVGQTAYQAILSERGLNAKSGKILILGGSSSVGQVAIQLAKLHGFHVITTASSRNFDFVKSLGADLVINYNQESWEKHADVVNIDFVFDTVGEKGAFEKCKLLLKSEGSYLSIANGEVGYNPHGHPPLKYASFFCLEGNSEHLHYLASLLSEGKLKISIDEIFPFTLDGVLRIMNKVDTGKSLGKNILQVSID